MAHRFYPFYPKDWQSNQKFKATQETSITGHQRIENGRIRQIDLEGYSIAHDDSYPASDSDGSA